MTQDTVKNLREKLAAIEHERWADWQRYMHSKMVEHSNGKGEWVCLPSDLFERWERQIATPYAELTEAEKQSDRDQVDRYWSFIEQALTQAHEEGAREERAKVVGELGMEIEEMIESGGWSNNQQEELRSLVPFLSDK